MLSMREEALNATFACAWAGRADETVKLRILLMQFSLGSLRVKGA
jgi:hypothetical protein